MRKPARDAVAIELPLVDHLAQRRGVQQPADVGRSQFADVNRRHWHPPSAMPGRVVHQVHRAVGVGRRAVVDVRLRSISTVTGLGPEAERMRAKSASRKAWGFSAACLPSCSVTVAHRCITPAESIPRNR